VGDTRTPFVVGDERETLVACLDYLRACVIAKVDDLDEEQARWSPVPSGTSLLWLVKHLTFTEAIWFPWGFAGQEADLPTDQVLAEDTVAGVVAGYRSAVALSNEVVAAAPDPDHPAARKVTGPGPMPLRWHLTHMVEETSRHAGHADILRELLDGQVGR
jgi:uncharacterized damage-inducible protein DinB